MAAHGGWTTAAVSTNVAAAVSPKGVHFDDDGLLYATSWTTSIGSRWGNDIVFGSYGGGDATIGSFAETATDNESSSSLWALTFTGTPGAWYAIEQSETLTNETWSVCTNAVVPADGTLQIVISPDPSAPRMFYRVRSEE